MVADHAPSRHLAVAFAVAKAFLTWTVTVVVLVLATIIPHPHACPMAGLLNRTDRPTSVVWNPVLPLIPVTLEAVTVTATPEAAEGCSVVAVVFSSR